MACLSVPVLEEAAQAVFNLPAPKFDSYSGLPVVNSTRSFWIDTPGANPLAKEGSDGELSVDADVCIIGSGITGVSAAYHLAKGLDARGRGPSKTVILEARDFCQYLCSGATGIITGRNGGHLTPVHFKKFVEREKRFGRVEAGKTYALEHHTTLELLKIINAEDWQDMVDLVSAEHVNLLVTETEVEQAKLDFNAASEAGLYLKEVEWLSGKQVQTTYGASFPAFIHPGNNIWPLKFVTQLLKLTQRLDPSKFDLRLHTNTPVTSMSPSSSQSRRWSLSTHRGDIQCSYVLHATNAYTSYLLPHLHGPNGIVPTRGQVMAIRATVPATNITKASWGGNQGSEYWFPRPVEYPEDHPLIILGGGRDASGPTYETYVADDSTVNKVVGRVLRNFLPGMFPGKYEKGREPEMEWTGIMGYTKIGDPFVGPVVQVGLNTSADDFKGQYISAGYTGHGMTRAFGCAETVAGMIVAEIAGEAWTAPEWFPRHFLTTERL
ncbi:hypothetical protein J132_11157 [Termitomyces sp. J132]|nr:hypothetical protein J132_11157 [Termitomyces sp. J132]